MPKKSVYLDNAATTPLDPRVFEKMLPFLKEDYGNPSSIHSYGRKTRIAIEEARETVAEFLNAKPGEIYFLSSGTEAVNFALFGIAKTEFLESGRKGVISTKTEHQAVLESMEELERQGFDVSFLDTADNSALGPEGFAPYLNQNCSLLSAIHINNETGAVNDIKKLVAQAHDNGSFFHTDAVQSFGKIKIDVNELKVDALSVSGHKIGGPKGSAAAYVRSGTPLSAMIFGGSQERSRRGGTENPAAIIGLAEAVKIASREMEANYERVSELSAAMEKGLREIDSLGIAINGGEGRSPYVLSATFLSEYYNNDPEAMLMFLDINGVAASNGAACTSGTLKPSHVIINSGRTPEDAAGTIRFSFGPQNTLDEINYAQEVVEKMGKRFKNI